jgi:hypothetical protein
VRRIPVLLATAGVAIAASLVPAVSAQAVSSTPSHWGWQPHQLFAPYYETYDTSTDMATVSRESGARYLSLAFLQTNQPGSCTAYWNGDTSQPIASSSYGADIAAIQAEGGNVIPSFGGYAADTTGTEIADSCTSVPAIAQVYESLITTYHVHRIDLDTEGDSVNNAAGINRRNEAVAMTEAWAAARGLPIQFSYTLPTFPTGLPPAEQSVLQNAVADGAKISTVNIMTFDYYIGTQQDMLADSESAASALVSFLGTLYPGDSQRQLWHMVGITEMPGIDDFGTAETFSLADAPALVWWAKQHDVGFLSFWASQRDNGGCPGTKGAGTCSGLQQPDWFFSHIFELFSH